MQKLYSPAESPEITSPEGGPNADALIIFTGPSSRGWHRLQVAAECLQKYAWNYEGPGGKIDISKRPPLITGSLIHLVLAQHYSRMKQEQLGLNPEEYMDPVEAVRFLADAQGNSAYVDDVLETYEVYRKQFYSDIRNMQIEAVETLFEGFITSDKKPDKKYLLTGRIDLLYRDMGGQLWCCDHKTTSRLTNKHREYFGVSGQMLAYEYLVRQRYPELAGFKINLIQHASAGVPKFERVTVAARPLLEKQFADRVIDIEEAIERVQAEGRALEEWPKAMSEMTCFTRYGACDFVDKCRFGAKGGKSGSWSWED